MYSTQKLNYHASSENGSRNSSVHVRVRCVIKSTGAISIINLRHNEGSSVKGHVFIRAGDRERRRACILKCVYRKHHAAYYAYLDLFYILCIRRYDDMISYLCVSTLQFLIRCIFHIILT